MYEQLSASSILKTPPADLLSLLALERNFNRLVLPPAGRWTSISKLEGERLVESKHLLFSFRVNYILAVQVWTHEVRVHAYSSGLIAVS